MKKSLRKNIFEKINRISATTNPEDSKYPLTLTVDIFPTSHKNLNQTHPSFEKNKKNIRDGDFYSVMKTITIQGDYAKSGSSGINTLRLKINESDWPEEWNFPNNEIERRLFLQTLRITNLKIITKFDEGGEEYIDISKMQKNISVKFEEESTEESTEELTGDVNGNQIDESVTSIEDVLEFLDILRYETLSNGENEISSLIGRAYREILSSLLSKKGK